MEPLAKATDPASDRLTEHQVISIHRAHIAGTSWNLIARDHGTTRKNVSRILQGTRWRELHPTNRPDLYGPAPAPVRAERKANLGLASTRELLAELTARADVAAAVGETWPDYRTVYGD